jgi:Tfp pilus assembly protein PilO
VTISERDRKILMLIIPLVVLAGYWFLILGPKRNEASVAADELAQQEQRLDTAKAAADQAKSAQNAFESDFTEVVRLGKAIPASVDMPSLIVQLDRASEGTDIRFTKIATGEREASAAPVAATPAPSTDSSASGAPVAAGGETASSSSGTAVESANNAQATANQNAANAEQSGVSPTDTQTSTGGVDPAAGATAADGTTAATTTTGLETVPLELEFVGDFFNLADFFHNVKRFVRVANKNVLVSGRLLTVEGVQWSSDTEIFPRLKATIKARVYLSPKSEGATAGATPQGPAAESTTPAGTTADDGSSPVPTATATP